MRNIILLLLIASFQFSVGQNNYKIIYEADSEGKAISGNREQLLKYVQNGNPIRVGWVLKFKHPQSEEIIEMQHWTDAGFITTLNGHVFAQIQSIYQQGPSPVNPPSVFLVDDKPHGWVAIIGSTGVMRQKYTRGEEMIEMMRKSGLSEEELEKQLKDLETMNVHTKWAVSQIP
ncbi:hypothetical protein [Spongiivirga citrea]|uniref:Uncharacterized protein n=1 Tax=Spongiivirga citrea TaxID=1481457 RepID=A0A6M0CQK9_9FLAO|nr:hypothetical protein [Spongiivirga citrea]NER17797.1 hypothetical protein [Spongiivirga citrea]